MTKLQNTPAAQEDAEEQQRMRQACQMLVQAVAQERAENKRKDEIIKWKDEVIARKDEELAWMRAESERKDAAHAEELSRMRANDIAFRKAAVTFLRGTPDTDNPKSAPGLPTVHEALDTPEARLLMQKLAEGGLLNARWQPVNLSNAEKGILAQYLSAELDIRNPWQNFASLWCMKPETLRRAAARAMEQKKSLIFQDRLKGLLKA